MLRRKAGNTGIRSNLLPKSRQQQQQKHGTKATVRMMSGNKDTAGLAGVAGLTGLTGQIHLQMELVLMGQDLIPQSRKQILQNQQQPSRATVGVVSFNQWQSEWRPWKTFFVLLDRQDPVDPVDPVPPVTVYSVWLHLRYPQLRIPKPGSSSTMFHINPRWIQRHHR